HLGEDRAPVLDAVGDCGQLTPARELRSGEGAAGRAPGVGPDRPWLRHGVAPAAPGVGPVVAPVAGEVGALEAAGDQLLPLRAASGRRLRLTGLDEDGLVRGRVLWDQAAGADRLDGDLARRRRAGGGGVGGWGVGGGGR